MTSSNDLLASTALHGWRGHLALLLLCALAFLPGLATTPVIDRDEARYMQATRQMLERGDFVTIRFQDEARHKKPAGIHWLQAASLTLLGHSAAAPEAWPYRLPSALAATAAVLALLAFGRRMMGEAQALLAAALLAVCITTTLEALQAKTDALLLLATVLMQGGLFGLYHRCAGMPATLAVPLFWGGLALGVLTKGPVAPGVAALTIAALCAADRELTLLRSLRPAVGLPILILLVAPWSIAVWLRTDGGFFLDAAREDVLPKLLSGHESHGAPPGFYALTQSLMLWPMSLFALPAVIAAFADRGDRLLRFLLAWLLPAWLLLEAVPTKLVHYTLPLYPALALLAARWLLHPANRQRWHTAYALSIAAVAVAAGVLLAVLPALLGDRPTPAQVLAALLLAATSVAVAACCWQRAAARAAGFAVAGALLFAIVFRGSYLPSLQALGLSERLAGVVEPLRAGTTGPVAIAGYHEPSVVFLLGTDTALVDGTAVARLLAAPGGASVGVVDRRAEADFQAERRRQGLAVDAIARVDGFNYSKGRSQSLVVYRPRATTVSDAAACDPSATGATALDAAAASATASDAATRDTAAPDPATRAAAASGTPAGPDHTAGPARP